MKKNSLRSILSQVTTNLTLVFCLIGPVQAHADEAGDITRLLRNGQLDQALARADAYLTTKPRDPQIRFLKGLVLTEQGKNAEAIKIFNRLTEDYPELPEPYNNLAVLYASQGQYEKARQSLEMAIRTHPSYATAYENLGDVYSKLASQSYDRALQLDSGNSTAEIKLSMVKDLISGNRNKPTPPTQNNPAPQGPIVAAATPSAQAATPVNTTTSATQSANSAGTSTAAATAAATTSATNKPTVNVQTAAASPATTHNQAVMPSITTAPTTAASPVQTTPSASTSRNADTEILNTLRNWAEAWSNQDVNQYLTFYSDKFSPSSGQSRSAWEAERRKRINNKGRIEVRVESPLIVYEGEHAIVQFKQIYSSDRLKNVGVKTLIFGKSGNKWLIVKEQASN